MIDLSVAGIAKLCGPAKSGEYSATVTTVSSSVAQGGGKLWHLAWKCEGVAAPVVEDLLVAVVGRPLAPALIRIASLLRANDKGLQYPHAGAAMKALVGCTATLAVTVDPLSGHHAIEVHTAEDAPAQSLRRAG